MHKLTRQINLYTVGYLFQELNILWIYTRVSETCFDVYWKLAWAWQ